MCSQKAGVNFQGIHSDDIQEFLCKKCSLDEWV